MGAPLRNRWPSTTLIERMPVSVVQRWTTDPPSPTLACSLSR